MQPRTKTVIAALGIAGSGDGGRSNGGECCRAAVGGGGAGGRTVTIRVR